MRDENCFYRLTKNNCTNYEDNFHTESPSHVTKQMFIKINRSGNQSILRCANNTAKSLPVVKSGFIFHKLGKCLTLVWEFLNSDDKLHNFGYNCVATL